MVIAYLYGELLNLYGNDGNVRMLVQKLTELGVEAEVRFVSVEDVPDFSQYDIVYMGSGTESNQRIAIEALKAVQGRNKRCDRRGKGLPDHGKFHRYIRREA